MDIAFLGGVFPKNLENEILKNSNENIHFAANNLQWSIIDGLDLINSSPICLLNVMLVGAYPKDYKKILIKTTKFSHIQNANDINVGFINLVGIRIISRFISATRILLKWARQKGKNKVILIYSLNTQFLIASLITKFLNPKIKLCLIVPDLPQYMSDSKNLIYRFLKSIDQIAINIGLKKIDAFVVINDSMKEKLKINQRPCVRVEGIFNTNNYDFKSEIKTQKMIMYSGNLDVNQGILDLLISFSNIEDENYKFIITGFGNGIKDILKYSAKDSRISYQSKLKQSELFELQKKSSLLLNPIKPTHPKVKYFFPSKTMEYLASGTPTLMYNLSCLPEEYKNFVYIINDTSSEGMRCKILEICSKPEKELIEFGMSAQKFILDQKCPIVQCNKIYTLLNRLFE